MTDNSQADESSFDQERERQLLQQIEEERAATATAPTGLFMLMLAPLLLIAIPLLLLWALRSSPANNSLELPTVASTAETTANPPAGSAIEWQKSFDEALILAQKTGKPIMADFYTDWCAPCKAMDAYTWPDASVVAESKNVIPVKINADNFRDIAQRYNVTGYPTIIWLDSQGREKGRIDGAAGPQDMLLLMQKYR